MEDYLLLDMNQTEVEVILGYKWLSELRETWINWKENTMSFHHHTSWVTVSNKEGFSKGSMRGYKRLLGSNTNVGKTAREHKNLMQKDVDHNLVDKDGFSREGRVMYARLGCVDKVDIRNIRADTYLQK